MKPEKKAYANTWVVNTWMFKTAWHVLGMPRSQLCIKNSLCWVISIERGQTKRKVIYKTLKVLEFRNYL